MALLFHFFLHCFASGMHHLSTDRHPGQTSPSLFLLMTELRARLHTKQPADFRAERLLPEFDRLVGLRALSNLNRFSLEQPGLPSRRTSSRNTSSLMQTTVPSAMRTAREARLPHIPQHWLKTHSHTRITWTVRLRFRVKKLLLKLSESPWPFAQDTTLAPNDDGFNAFWPHTYRKIPTTFRQLGHQGRAQFPRSCGN